MQCLRHHIPPPEEYSVLHILIPVFNNAAGLEASLASVPDSEICPVTVVDNASVDDTTNVIDRFASTRRHMKVVRNPVNVGRIGNWNRCLETAEALGARHVLLLMAGDRYICPEGVDPMALVPRQHTPFNDMVTFFPILMEGRNTATVRDLRSKNITDKSSVLQNMFYYGIPFLGPLQACIISSSRSLFGRFEEITGSYHADQDYVFSRVIQSDVINVGTQSITAMNLSLRRTHGTVPRSKLLRQDLEFMRRIYYSAYGRRVPLLRYMTWIIYNIYRYYRRSAA